ncbi:Ig-like domain-containing protein [Methanobrevibacter sp. UBA212]|uniref:Ig-like domain-containing protein n=1 Tax=Methanobrevibacter sp. UBA212 TaxID=1915476 RepID=UPI0025F43E3D|nr:Ig-like domain-containing protein [Methanobrevibacter sp. UBA212]
MENRNIIIILLVVIVVCAAAIGFALFNPTHAKEPTKIKITSDKEQYKKDAKLSIELKDLNKTPISKEIVNVTITDKNGKVVVDDVLKTDSKGKAKLDLNLKKGKYKVNVTYGGNENYTGNNTTQNLKIKEKAAKAKVESSSSDESYTYSRQAGRYIRDSGDWSQSANGDQIYSYKGDDGVIYEKYYDANGNPVSSEEHYR